MNIKDQRVLLCTCEKTMQLDPKKITKGLGANDEAKPCNHLCRTEVARFADALSTGDDLLVACTQEAPLFRELADEAKYEGTLSFTNIRERAGWSAEGANASPKISALLAEAALDIPEPRALPINSDGVCLVYGDGQAALEAARKLNEHLSVSLLLRESSDVIPPNMVDVPIHAGEITAAQGHFGSFEITVNGYAPAMASSRSQLEFLMAQDGAASSCSIIFDMSAADPLFPAHEKRDGYFKCDHRNPAALSDAIFEAAQLAGEFEKPLYVSYSEELCAHSRSTIIGCTRCLDVCPASAITPAGDLVEFDHVICGGCGSCSSVCPSGAVSYAMPKRISLGERVQTLLNTYLAAGGTDPHLLVHDERHGAEMISAMSRFGKGLPANVIPFALNEVTQTGHDWFATAFASGASSIYLLVDPKKRDETEGLKYQAELVTTLLDGMGYEGTQRITLCDEADPDKVEALVWTQPQLKPLLQHGFVATNDKREMARTALTLLNSASPSPQDTTSLPVNAPYGQISINTEGCTMCLACVSACPMNALSDNPEKPQVNFVEQACVQCGLCRSTCPENVITLEPRYNFTASAISPTVLNEEEPFECISCGKPFGSRSTIERIS
ncbi:MAG: 4Fe-4S binding protein, partial [Hyphomicrobiales bacterium]